MTPEALEILKHALKAFSRRKRDWGKRNSYTASPNPSPALSELLQGGFIVPATILNPTTTEFKATAAGMRAAGLSPSQIERAIKL